MKPHDLNRTEIAHDGYGSAWQFADHSIGSQDEKVLLYLRSLEQKLLTHISHASWLSGASLG